MDEKVSRGANFVEERTSKRDDERRGREVIVVMKEWKLER